MIKEISLELDRAESYKFLSECYYIPDEKQVETIKRFGINSCKLYSELSEHIPYSNNDLEELLIDHSRLFVGPFRLLSAPYGSIYLENGRTLHGESTADLLNWYREEGLELNMNEVHDHVAIELEFMYFLVTRELKAIKKNDKNKVQVYRQKQKAFLNTHLGSWIADFTNEVEKHARTDFYKKLAQITRSFVRNDQEYLKP